MLFINRYVPYFSGLLVAVCLTLWSLQPSIFVYIGVALLLINVLATLSLSASSPFSSKFWSIFFTPFFLLVGSFLFLLTAELQLVQILFSVIVSFIYLLVLKNIFEFFYHPPGYQPYALENIYGYVNMISLFLLFFGYNGLFLFLRYPLWIFITLTLITSGLLYMRTLWSYKIQWQQAKVLIIFSGILMAEFFLVVNLLPTSYIFNALVMIVVYYLYLNVSKDYLRQRLEGKTFRKYIFISAAVILVSFFTTPWY